MAKVRVPNRVEWFDGAIGSNGIVNMTGAVAPTIAVQRRGARNINMGYLGRSGRVKAVDTEYYWPSPGDGIFTLEGWFNIKRMGQTVGGQLSGIMGGHRAAGQIITVAHQVSRELVWSDGVNGNIPLGSFLTRAGWIYLAMLINHSAAAGIAGYGLLRMDPGGNVLAYIHDRKTTALGGQTIDRFQGLFNNSVYWAGSVSALSLYQLGALADATIYPADVLQPPTFPIEIHFGPEGLTTNEGSPNERLPLDSARINDEIKYGTLDGDTIVIDTPNGAWNTGATPFIVDMLDTVGATVEVRGYPKHWADVSGPATVWVLHSGTIWKTTDNNATDLANVCMLEDGVPPLHPVGANIGAVAALLEANTGYYSDGSFLYLVANDHSNPNTNGKKYLRSRDRAGQNAMHIRNVRNFTLKNWFTSLTMQVDKANNNLPTGGCLAIEDVCTGFIELYNCGGEWCGEQCFGRGTIGADLAVRYYDSRLPIDDAHLHPYCNIGSALPSVDEPTDSSTTQTAEYIRGSCGCTNAWSSHSDNGKLALVKFTDVNYGNSALSTQGVVTSTVITGKSTVGNINNEKGSHGAPEGPVTIDKDVVVNGFISGANIIFVKGSTWRPKGTAIAGNVNQMVFGTITLHCYIFDDNVILGDVNAAFMYRIAAGTFTFTDVDVNGLKDIALIANAAAGEVVSDNNRAHRASSKRWLENYNGGDLTGDGAKALGIDVHTAFGGDTPRAFAAISLLEEEDEEMPVRNA